MTDKPETDAAWSYFRWYIESLHDVRDLSCKLERERDTAIAERDALAKALEECKEDSIELLGERDWWKDEPRSDYKKRYEETLNNIARADAALAAVKNNQPK
jgi:hypothetical protein